MSLAIFLEHKVPTAIHLDPRVLIFMRILRGRRNGCGLMNETPTRTSLVNLKEMIGPGKGVAQKEGNDGRYAVKGLDGS